MTQKQEMQLDTYLVDPDCSENLTGLNDTAAFGKLTSGGMLIFFSRGFKIGVARFGFSYLVSIYSFLLWYIGHLNDERSANKSIAPLAGDSMFTISIIND